MEAAKGWWRALAPVAMLWAALAGPASAESGQNPGQGHRLAIPLLSFDVSPSAAGDLPPADSAYCPGQSGPAGGPPNTVFGTLHLGGEAAPSGTVVQIMFDGLAGPAGRTTATGGYRVDYAAGGGDCANHIGALIEILVDGRRFGNGTSVGDDAARPFLRLDIAG